MMEATAHQEPIQSPNYTLSVPKTIYVILEPAVENMIMYIPVEEATAGGTPMLSKRGLKMAPPPSPSAPETHPPRRAKITSLYTTEPSNLTSLFAMPLPTFFFSVYSVFTFLTPK